MSMCAWCGNEGDLTKIEHLGSEVEICNACKKAVENKVCISCGKKLELSNSLGVIGLCNDCLQEKKTEQYRRDIEERELGFDLDYDVDEEEDSDQEFDIDE